MLVVQSLEEGTAGRHLVCDGQFLAFERKASDRSGRLGCGGAIRPNSQLLSLPLRADLIHSVNFNGRVPQESQSTFC